MRERERELLCSALLDLEVVISGTTLSSAPYYTRLLLHIYIYAVDEFSSFGRATRETLACVARVALGSIPPKVLLQLRSELAGS